jgi:hypothetical protein
VRGYGPIKREAAARAQATERQLWEQWAAPTVAERRHASAA